jgi:hypothetical protein
MPRGPVRVGWAGTTCSASGADLRALRHQFDREHCLRLTEFLDPGVLAWLRAALERAEFTERSPGGIGLEHTMRPDASWGLLHLLVNDPALFAIVETITGCPPIVSFIGRVYRMAPGAGHYDEWHTDAVRQRLVALSTNLSARPYAGGLLQIRGIASGIVLAERANVGLGNALLFRIADDLEHRLTEVVGETPKMAFAGWFTRGQYFLARPRQGE